MRKRQINDLISHEKIDIIDLQETTRQDFSDSELSDIARDFH